MATTLRRSAARRLPRASLPRARAWIGAEKDLDPAGIEAW